MPGKANALTAETFKFFGDLGRNNNTAWMETNRERYRACVVAPFRALLDQIAPAAAEARSRYAHHRPLRR